MDGFLQSFSQLRDSYLHVFIGIARYAVPEQVNGYEYEFREAVRCIEEGKLEPDSMPHADTLEVMERMDALRKSWGVVYPQEQ